MSKWYKRDSLSPYWLRKESVVCVTIEHDKGQVPYWSVKMHLISGLVVDIYSDIADKLTALELADEVVKQIG